LATLTQLEFVSISSYVVNNDSTMSQKDFDDFATKGRKVWDDCMEKYDPPRLDPPLPDIERRGYQQTPEKLDTAKMAALPSLELLRNMNDLGQTENGYVWIEIGNSGPSSDDQTAYQNYIHKDGQFILCMNNYAKRDRVRDTEQGLVWSEIMAVCCSRVGQDFRNLQAIWRISISNKVCMITYRIEIIYSKWDQLLQLKTMYGCLGAAKRLADRAVAEMRAPVVKTIRQ
jgi:hypothetical protein